MASKYFGGVVPARGQGNDRLRDIQEKTFIQVENALNELAFQKALIAIGELVSAVNKYIAETAPFTLAKDEGKKDELSMVIYNILDALRVIALFVFPFMPTTAEKMWDALGIKEKITQQDLSQKYRWGGLPSGAELKKIPPLFPRVL
jgi:methionyl-tRNA synthetase